MGGKKEAAIYECTCCDQPYELKLQLCPICITQKIIRGKWKLVILWLLKDGEKRFSYLQKSITQVKQGYLTNQLRELENDGLINRTSYNTVPPRVEYSLSKAGIDFLSVMKSMNMWGKKYIDSSTESNNV